MSPRTIFLGRLIGLFTILIALAMLSHWQITPQTVKGMVHDPAGLLIIGMIATGVGLAMVLSHNVWSGGALPVVVTLMGWIILLRGVLLLFIPPAWIAVAFDWILLHGLLPFGVIVGLVVGSYLTYAGFTARSASNPGTRGTR
jgi:hypothetical protein